MLLTFDLNSLLPVEFLLKYGKLTPINQSQFPTLQQDNNSNSEWNSLVLNVAS
jgi:putative transposase